MTFYSQWLSFEISSFTLITHTHSESKSNAYSFYQRPFVVDKVIGSKLKHIKNRFYCYYVRCTTLIVKEWVACLGSKQAQFITIHRQVCLAKVVQSKSWLSDGCYLTSECFWTEKERFGSPQLSWVVGPDVRVSWTAASHV